MKIQHILFVFLISLTLFSCDSEKKELKKQHDKVREEQQHNYEKMIAQYSAVFLDQASLVSKFSYEMKEDLFNKNIACVANIFDIKRTESNQYILFAKSENLSLELQLNQITLDKILEYRSELSKKDDGLFKWYGLSETPILFIIKPNDLLKKHGLYKSLTDYEYDINYESDSEERNSYKEVELTDYTIELELTNDGFHIKGDCIDLTLVSMILINSSNY